MLRAMLEPYVDCQSGFNGIVKLGELLENVRARRWQCHDRQLELVRVQELMPVPGRRGGSIRRSADQGALYLLPAESCSTCPAGVLLNAGSVPWAPSRAADALQRMRRGMPG